MRKFGRKRRFCRLLLTSLLMAAPAMAAAKKPPPKAATAPTPPATPAPAPVPVPSGPVLAKGEIYIPLQGGCGIVEGSMADDAQPLPAEVAAQYQSLYGTYKWTGSCRFGVAHGEGSFSPGPNVSDSATITSTDNFYYGHQLNRSTSTTVYNIDGAHPVDVETTIRSGNRFTSVKNLTDYNNPAFESVIGASQLTVGEGTKVSYAYTDVSSCAGMQEYPAYRGCEKFVEVNGQTQYAQVYGVRLVTPEKPDGVVYGCPDITTPAGCEKLWISVIAPLRTAAEDVNNAYLSDRAALAKKLDALYAPQEQALLDQQAARAKAQADEKARNDAAAAAEKAKADKIFAAKLKSANAGELFSMADDFNQKGDAESGRTALRALISRFPNSPLAGIAAQQLSK